MTYSSLKSRRRQGFTLVEMLVVLGILVLLASMVLPRILGSQKKADIRAAQTQIGMFRGSLEQYAVDCKDFPLTEQGLQALVSPPADLAETVKWGGPYVTGEIPRDPWGNEYRYEYPPTRGSGDYPDIWSAGPDGQDDTEDDICSWTSGAGAGEGDVMTEEGTGKGAVRSGAKGAPSTGSSRKTMDTSPVNSRSSSTRGSGSSSTRGSGSSSKAAPAE
jgi:general secretion pathway protein G